MEPIVKLFGLVASGAVIFAFVFLSLGGGSISVGETKTLKLGKETIRLELDDGVENVDVPGPPKFSNSKDFLAQELIIRVKNEGTGPFTGNCAMFVAIPAKGPPSVVIVLSGSPYSNVPIDRDPGLIEAKKYRKKGPCLIQNAVSHSLRLESGQESQFRLQTGLWQKFKVKEAQVAIY